MKLVLLFVLTLGFAGLLVAQERVNLTVPEVRPSTTYYRLERLELNLSTLTVVVDLRGENNEFLRKEYDNNTTPTGATLLTAVNRGNFSTNSLAKAIYNRLALDGVLVGTVAGSAQ